MDSPSTTTATNTKTLSTEPAVEKAVEETAAPSTPSTSTPAATEESGKTEKPVFKNSEVEEIEKWEEFNLPTSLLRGIYAHGFDKPSKIQSRGIKPILSGSDVIAQAQSGTGKTGTFCISTLGRIDPTVPKIQALILAPTRELANQNYGVISSIGAKMEGLRTALIMGGVSKVHDFQALEAKPHVIIGTPGRVSDLIVSSKLIVSDIKLFVLDEADEMLSRGFSEQVHKVFMYLNPEIQVVLISATMPKDVLEVTQKFMRDPITILVKNEDLTLEGIRQFYIDVREEKHKLRTLLDIWTRLKISQAVIFCNTKRRVEILAEDLQTNGISVTLMHGGMEQAQRDQIMDDFRNLKSRVLISTDLLSRGIDVQQVSIVINYDIPKKQQTYIHRIGRGGRFGRKGVAINFVRVEDAEMMSLLEEHYNCVVEEMPEDVDKYF